MNILINYADKKYRNARFWNTLTGRYRGNFDKIYSYGPEDIDCEFKEKHSEIFNYKRGNGLWLWKPYIINKTINKCSDGDIIFYCDSGACFIRNPKYLYQHLYKCPIFCCDIPLIEANFTKPECFEKLNMNVDKIKYSNQIIATFFVIKVCEESKSFIKEWLELCCDHDLLSPSGSNTDLTYNHGYNFVVHREDQSLFSLLCKKHGYKPHRDISQRAFSPMSYYNPYYIYKEPIHENDTYPTIIYLHKSPRLGLIYFSKLILKYLLGLFYKIISK